MIPRGKLYINYTDILAGIYYCLTNAFRSKSAELGRDDNKLICLSVRTGFDLVLSSLNLPQGSEILVTDINIPDMFNIITGHGLVPVPLAVDKHSLNISAQQVEVAITPNTKAILITHLFGGIVYTDEVIGIAKQHDLLVFEDCAQAFAGDEYNGNTLTDVLMFSFGFIKTSTAISGAQIKIKDDVLLADVVLRNTQYPRQRNTTYFKKLCKVSFVMLLTKRSVYTVFYKLVMALGKDFEDVLDGFTKGFPPGDVLKHIRYRPCAPNIKLVERRLRTFDQHKIGSRKLLGRYITDHIPERYKIGELNTAHTFWVLPIECAKADDLIVYLRRNGFDASQKASSLVRFAGAKNLADTDELQLQDLVYLPMYPSMSNADRDKLIALLNTFGET